MFRTHLKNTPSIQPNFFRCFVEAKFFVDPFRFIEEPDKTSLVLPSFNSTVLTMFSKREDLFVREEFNASSCSICWSTMLTFCSWKFKVIRILKIYSLLQTRQTPCSFLHAKAQSSTVDWQQHLLHRWSSGKSRVTEDDPRSACS